MLWLLLMAAAAVARIAYPILREDGFPAARHLSAILATFVVVGSFALYDKIGAPTIASGRAPADGSPPDIQAMVDGLAARLERQPDDLDGWRMLGRSYLMLGEYDLAVSAFTSAVEIGGGNDADTLASLAEATLAAGNSQQLTPDVVSLFERALEIQPDHPRSLFYAGIAASNRGDTDLAARRWERLLAGEPPAEYRALIEKQVAAWRGEVVAPSIEATVEAPGAILTASISLSDSARAALPEQATVFIIARDPNQPTPPIAGTRRTVSELPADVALGDRDAMIPGRSLSAFDEVELVARVSLSGQTTAQPGDWYGALQVQTFGDEVVELTIDTQVVPE